MCVCVCFELYIKKLPTVKKINVNQSSQVKTLIYYIQSYWCLRIYSKCFFLIFKFYTSATLNSFCPKRVFLIHKKKKIQYGGHWKISAVLNAMVISASYVVGFSWENGLLQNLQAVYRDGRETIIVLPQGLPNRLLFTYLFFPSLKLLCYRYIFKFTRELVKYEL